MHTHCYQTYVVYAIDPREILVRVHTFGPPDLSKFVRYHRTAHHQSVVVGGYQDDGNFVFWK